MPEVEILKYSAIVEVSFEHESGSATSKMRTSRVVLEAGQKEIDAWFNKDNQPTQEGCKAMRAALTAGMISIIHLAHEMKLIDSAENLRYIISKLEEGFIAIPEIILPATNQKNNE